MLGNQLSLKMSTARYYHYTSKQSAEDIIRTTEIRPTIKRESKRGKVKDAHFGSGVYLTVLPPIPGQKENILKNNWRSTKAKYFEKCEMFIEIEIPRSDTKVIVPEADDNRDIRLYKGTINLENYQWTYGVYEEDDVHDPIDCQPCKQKWMPDKFARKRKKLAMILAETFEKSVMEDFYPPFKLSQLFGVQILQPRNVEESLEFRKMEEIVFCAWIGLIRISEIVPDHNILAEALVQGNLSQMFERWICEKLSQPPHYGPSGQCVGPSNYDEEISKRGFQAINWITLDEYITQRICINFVVPQIELSPEKTKVKEELTEQLSSLKERIPKMQEEKFKKYIESIHNGHSVPQENSTKQTDLMQEMQRVNQELLDLSKRMGNCEYCDMPTTQFCSKCRKAWFCSKTCQMSCWSYHRIFCIFV